MNHALHKNLLSEVAKLKRITAELSIKDLTTFVSMQQINFNHGRTSGNLGSPLKQGMYLLALASSQPEPEHPKSLDDGKHAQLIRRLESIFNKYGLAYFPTKNELIIGLGPEWRRQREIAMPAFLHYFMSGFKASTVQIKSWIENCFDGFECEIADAFGMTHIDMLNIAAFIESEVERNAVPVTNAMVGIKALHQQFIDQLQAGIDFQQAIENARSASDAKELFETFLGGAHDLCQVSLKRVEAQFGVEIAKQLVKNFVALRGSTEPVTYITDRSPLVGRPLLSADGEHVYFLANNSFYQAVIENLEAVLSKGAASTRYLKERDRRLEKLAAQHLKKLFPSSAKFYESAFETAESHGEHDLVIVHGKNIYIVEAKASPPKEPLRDPSKAAIRIRDHFRGRNGIQKAFEQANKLREKILANPTTKLFDKKGRLLVELYLKDVQSIYCICITRDDFGLLATNLTLLLEKDSTSPYPWVVCITDLEYLVDAFVHLGEGIDTLDRYMEQRVRLHGKVIGMDELECAGVFLKHGGLDDFINSEADLINLAISDSDVFDKIHRCIQNGEQYELKISPANLSPLDRSKLFGSRRQAKAQKKSLKHKKKIKNKQAQAARKRNSRR